MSPEPAARAAARCAVLLFLLAPGGVSHAVDYYVDRSSPACSNTGPGTEAQPYCGIAAAAAAHNGPGVTIYVKPGVYREQVTVPASGTAGNPFVFQALAGTVVVDGSDDFSSPALWIPYSEDVYLAATVSWNPSQVFMNGERLTPSVSAPSSLPDSSFTWVSGEGLYVNAGGDEPGEFGLLVGRRNYGFNLFSKSWVTIDGFTVAHTESRGIYVNSGCSDVVVSRDTVSFANSYGIQVVNGLRIALGECRSSDNNLHGIGLTGGSTACTLRSNESLRNADPAVRRANGIHLFSAPANYLFGNRVHDNQDSGVHFGDGSNGCIAYNNRSWNNGDHGYDHLNATGTSHLHDVAAGNHMDGFSIEDSASGSRLDNCIAIDNGLTTGRFDLWVDGPSLAGFLSDYNIFWNSTTQKPFKIGATQYETIAAYQAATGQDAHSVQADPLFVNGPAGDFHLMAGSPAIDAGTSGAPSWPTLDADGMARVDDPATANGGAGPVPFADRGSFEFLVDQAPVVTAPESASVAENHVLTIDVTAADPDGDAIDSLTVAGLPPGASFAPGPGDTTGTLTWTPDFAQAGGYTLSFVAHNALSGADTTEITITDTDRAPVVTAPATASAAENNLLTFDVTAADPDGDAIDSLTVAGLPPGASFTPGPGDTTGTLTWTPDFAQAGGYTLSFVAHNALSGADTTEITITDTDRAPVVTAPATASAAENNLLMINVTAADPDGDAIDSLTVAGLPPGAWFTPGPGDTTGTLTWTPAFGTTGVYTATFTATNALWGADTTEITVTETDRAPLLTSPATASVAENDRLTLIVIATDPDGNSIDSLSVAGLPPGASFTPGPGDTTGTLTWTPHFAQAGSYSVCFGAHNALSGSDTTEITVENTDRAPLVTAPPTASVAENDSVTIVVTAIDPDGDAIDSLTAVGLPLGATFTADPGDTSGTFRWAPTSGQAGVYTVTFLASDAMTGSDSTAITVSAPTAGVVVGPALGPPLQPRITPNPIRHQGRLRFGISRDGALRVQVFDLTGRAVRTLMDETDARAGEYELGFDVGSGSEGPLPQGLYFYRIQTSEGTARGRFMVVR